MVSWFTGVALLTGGPEHMNEKKRSNKHKEDLAPSAMVCTDQFN